MMYIPYLLTRSNRFAFLSLIDSLEHILTLLHYTAKTAGRFVLGQFAALNVPQG